MAYGQASLQRRFYVTTLLACAAEASLGLYLKLLRVKGLHAVASSFAAAADGGNTPLGSHAPVYVFATPRGSPSLAPLFSSPIRGHHTVLRVPVPVLTQHHR